MIDEFRPSAIQVQPGDQRHVLIVGGTCLSLVNFRGPLIQALIGAGCRVSAAAGDIDDSAVRALKRWGVEFHPVALSRTGMSVLGDAITLWALFRLISRLRPDVFIGYTIKPVVYGLLAAFAARVRERHALVTGLGYAFTDGPEFKRTIARWIARASYWLALRAAQSVVFQNEDDRASFYRMGLVRGVGHSSVVEGSGVDVNTFSVARWPAGPLTFLMIARVLKDKGAYEFVEAAQLVREKFPECIFRLVGPIDSNPASIRLEQVETWVRNGWIEYAGALDDVRPAIADAHVYVLPSYREGMPRTVLEAMSMGRPVITTDVPGCRQTVIQGQTGLLVPARDGAGLAQACFDMIKRRDELQLMGRRGRRLVEEKFDSSSVARQLLEKFGLAGAQSERIGQLP